MSDELWSDERIRGEFGSDAYGAPSLNQMMRESYTDDGDTVVSLDEVIETAKRMRDDYETRIAELEKRISGLKPQPQEATDDTN